MYVCIFLFPDSAGIIGHAAALDNLRHRVNLDI